MAIRITAKPEARTNLSDVPELVVKTPGVRQDYALDAKPLGRGGYADVYRAVHKPTGHEIAFKKLRTRFDDDAQKRMRREVLALQALAGHPNVMPILDADPSSRWYVMPLATQELTKLALPLDDRTITRVLSHAAAGLAHAHAHGYVHRDVKPPNILQLGTGSEARWVVSDWGLVRKPRGMTTTLVTPTGRIIGTEGFIAPEVLRGAHKHSTAKADVYSLGRVAYWAASGNVPLAAEDVVPAGPFRQLVRRATRPEPARITLDEFQDQLSRVNLEPPPAPAERAAKMVERASADDLAAAVELFNLADEHPEDAELLLDHVARLDRHSVAHAVAADPDQAGRLVEAMARQLSENFGDRNFNYLNVPLEWLEDVGRAAEQLGDLGLLEDAADALFKADPYWARYDQRHRTRRWLMQLTGPAARTVARALQANPTAVDWYMEEGWRPSNRADSAVRGALQSAPA